MIRHLPMLSATVIPAGSLLVVTAALRPQAPDWSVRHRPRSGSAMVPAPVIVAALAAERESGALPKHWFGPVQLWVPTAPALEGGDPR